MATDTRGPEYDRKRSSSLQLYDRAREDVGRIFADKLSTGERMTVVWEELSPLLLLSVGYLAASSLLNSFMGIAWAAPSNRVLGLSHHEWSMAVYLAYNAVVIAILVILIITIVNGSKSQWAWRTASFLLGFLIKSISTVPTF